MNNEKNKKIWIEKVHENLALRGRSEKTYINYKSALIKFLNCYDENTVIKKLKEEDIIRFLNDEYIKPNKSKNSYNLCIASIRLFYLVCFGKTLNRLLLPSCKLPKRLPTLIPKNVFIKIFNSDKNIKHKCWLILAFCSGLRVEEVSKVKVEDLLTNEHKIKIIGKGNKERSIYLNQACIDAINSYLPERPNDAKHDSKNSEKDLFLSSQRTRISKRTVHPDSSFFVTIKMTEISLF